MINPATSRKNTRPNHPSRRAFLKTATLTAGAAALSTGPLILRGASAASTAANSKLNLAMVGCGGQGRGDMKNLIHAGANIVAFCDPDASMIERARKEAIQAKADYASDVKGYEDYRKLLENAAAFDAVLVATPDHWHAPLAKAFMKAGKHVYCEKPLTHSIAEARELGQLARDSKVVTQMGNQGSASESLRRCVEIIKAGRLGQIREIHHWGIGVNAKEGNAEGQDPIPSDFNWDLWVGPSGMRPFKANTYHPYTWRGWFDFGNGGLADFCCHAINLPLRALALEYPQQLVINMQDGKQVAGKAAVEFHFAARGELPAVTLYWHGSNTPDAAIFEPVAKLPKSKNKGGMLVCGEKGVIFTSHWNTGGAIRLSGESSLEDVSKHSATSDIAKSLPRCKDHYSEFVDACRGEGKTFSPFEFGSHLTEIGLSGVVALRTGKNLDWDGQKMAATNAPEAARFIKTEHREKWLL